MSNKRKSSKKVAVQTENKDLTVEVKISENKDSEAKEFNLRMINFDNIAIEDLLKESQSIIVKAQNAIRPMFKNGRINLKPNEERFKVDGKTITVDVEKLLTTSKRSKNPENELKNLVSKLRKSNDQLEKAKLRKRIKEKMLELGIE